MKKILNTLFVAGFIFSGFIFTPKANATSVITLPATTLPRAQLNKPYTANVPFTNSGNYALNGIWTKLPNGIVGQGLPSDPNHVYSIGGASGNFVLSGTPTIAGSYIISLSVDDQYGGTAYQTYTLYVDAPPTMQVITTSLYSPTLGQAYSGRIRVSYNGLVGPNVSLSNLPPGLSLKNSSDGFVNTIYALSQKDSDGFYYIDIVGTPTQAGNFNTDVYFFDTTHTFDFHKVYPITVTGSGSGSLAPAPAPTPFPTYVPVSNTHPNNTNILGSDGTVYRIQNGFRYPYTSAGAFLSYGFNSWSGVVAATAADMQLPVSTYTPNGATQATTYFIPPRNGSLINDKGTIYLITNGLRTGFTSEKVFLGLGYSFANAQPGDTSFMVTLKPLDSNLVAHPDGTLINDNGTIYLVKNSQKLGFPSMQIFYSWGLKLNEVVKANSYDKALPASGVVDFRMENQLSI